MTRMWMVNPLFLCRQHLLGEHKELHQLVGSINAGNSIDGHIENGQVDTSRINERHTELVEEMQRRGYNHNSPLEYDDELNQGEVNVLHSFKDLMQRCPDCYKRAVKHFPLMRHADIHNDVELPNWRGRPAKPAGEA